MSAESRALVGLFFAVRAARPPRDEPRRAATIGVLGAGRMGAGIAQVAARAGERVRLLDSEPAAVGRALAAAAGAWRSSRRRRRATAADERVGTARLQPSDLSGLRGCEIVIEAVVEDLAVKRELLARVAAEALPEAILASNTSTLPIARLAEGLPNPERVIGLHFFSPVAKMPLLEIVRHPGTSAATVERALALAGALGKTPIVVADGPGFYTTRAIGAWTAHAVALLAAGHSVTEVDAAGRRAGFPVGPLTLLDEVGLEVAARAARTLHEAFPARFPEPGALEGWVAEGRLGRRSGRGFYDYRGGRKRADASRSPHPHAAPVRTVADLDELAEQLRLALVAEAVRCLEEGILGSPGDGDLGAVLGLGFPPETGGPFRWIDALGAAEVCRRLGAWETAGALFAPPGLLRSRAASSRGFH
jgi:3-hydroxyacyl-CoA dehydrogenase/enoyl-CoA hydratase/3-hydroxybutyryl-CoA epimerase